MSAEKPFVFISHDTRDAEIAEAFANLLRDASGGMLPSFRSSDKKGTAGIPFGEEWYAAVMSKLAQASDVVALLTPHSVGRPWILYEAGVAKGSRNTKAYGREGVGGTPAILSGGSHRVIRVGHQDRGAAEGR